MAHNTVALYVKLVHIIVRNSSIFLMSRNDSDY